MTSRRWIWISGVVLLVACAMAIGWAGAVVFAPAKDVVDSTPYTYATVEEGSVGSSISLNTTANWTSVPVGVNRAVGIVTDAGVQPGSQVTQGSVLYSVNLSPVVIAQGNTPAFRGISAGTQGADVAQLQAMLKDLGLYSGKVDGKDGAATGAAIRAWQKAKGVPSSGIVDVGDVIFVPTLPARVALDEKAIARGATLSGGENVVRSLSASPSFDVPVNKAQAALMPAGTPVRITSPKGETWVGVAREQTVDPTSAAITVELKSSDSGAICGDACGEIPVSGDTQLFSRIVTVATVKGLTVPSAALVTDAAGRVALIAKDGKRLAVTVKTSARGMSVITGVRLGTRVRIPAMTN